MKFDNWNILLFIPIVLWTIILGIGTQLTTKVWIKILLLIIAIITDYKFLKKMIHLPRPSAEYKGLTQKVDLLLDNDFQADIYLFEKLDKYDFLNRYVEVLSPLINRDRTRVVLSPKFYEEQDTEIVQIAVSRELIRYSRGTQVKIFCLLTVPLLLLAIIIELFFLGNHKGWFNLSGSVFHFIAPFIVMLLISGILALWNKISLQADYQLDAALLKYYQPNQIERYIHAWEKLEKAHVIQERKEEREQLEDHYINKRIEELHKNH